MKTEEVPGKPTNIIHPNVYYLGDVFKNMIWNVSKGCQYRHEWVFIDSHILVLQSLRSGHIHLQIVSDDINTSWPVSQKTPGEHMIGLIIEELFSW